MQDFFLLLKMSSWNLFVQLCIWSLWGRWDVAQNTIGDGLWYWNKHLIQQVSCFNIHVCCPSASLFISKFITLTNSFNLTQSVKQPSHDKGHTLKLVLSHRFCLDDVFWLILWSLITKHYFSKLLTSLHQPHKLLSSSQLTLCSNFLPCLFFYVWCYH